MKFEKIYFNENFWKGKTKEEFIAHERHHPLSEKQLGEAFDLMNPPIPEEGKAVEPAKPGKVGVGQK